MDILKIGGYASAIGAVLLLAKNLWTGVIVINSLNNTVVRLNKEIEKLSIAFEEMKLEDEKQSNSIRSILRQLIINYTNDILDRGYIYKEEIYCIRQLYEGYALLGGNCTIEERVKEVIKLPAKTGKFNPRNDIIEEAIEEIENIKKESK
uniref:Uncharacterized protein n=1 Tax=Siphoviridae sp. ctnR613 TaxID=2827939 RepID=A0A8S5SNR9_9CAUD|nr:MAG TPA: hypothetical protein [Siphoviridae sp. ctnR613]